ncbi:MATE family efflux transporter [Spirochaeta cellobiosiphila]|uniref:MATE family efflux transporter n=1 Tax=Spirochaeta cellobiosiphila TaxID=504483 RepID=UPI0004159E42|nr:MATE family efflux transporter [Spirochaeta cellobiosiphila]
MKRRYEFKTILLMGIPLLFSRLSNYFHQVTDSMMMGHYQQGSDSLAALAMAGLFIWVFNTMLWPLGSGVQAVCTRREGNEKLKPQPDLTLVGLVLDNGILLVSTIALIAMFLSLSAPFFMTILLKDDNIRTIALEYIRILRWTFLPLGLSAVMQRFLGAVHRPRYVMISSILSNVLNIVLNYFLIFGKGIFPQLGITGAALGTLISQCIALIFLLTVLKIDKYFAKYEVFHFKKMNFKMMQNIFRLAYPIALQNGTAFIVLMIFESFVGNVGSAYLAATHVVFSSFRINKTLVGGFGLAASIHVGNALGEKNTDQAIRYARTSKVFAYIVGMLVFIAFFFFPEVMARAFSSEGDTIAVIAKALHFFAPFYFIEILGFSYELIFVSNGWSKFVLLSEMFTNVVFIIGFSYLASIIVPGNIYYIWLGFGLYQLFHSFIIHGGYYSRKWLLARTE